MRLVITPFSNMKGNNVPNNLPVKIFSQRKQHDWQCSETNLYPHETVVPHTQRIVLVSPVGEAPGGRDHDRVSGLAERSGEGEASREDEEKKENTDKEERKRKAREKEEREKEAKRRERREKKREEKERKGVQEIEPLEVGEKVTINISRHRVHKINNCNIQCR